MQYFLAFVFGTAFGSFGNVLIARLPGRASILGRSRCPRCGTVLKAWQVIPFVSHLLLRGRCAACKKNIAMRYWLIEFLSGLLGVLAYILAPSISAAVALGVAFVLLLCCAAIDVEHHSLPDVLTLPTILACAIAGVLCGTQNMAAIAVCTSFFAALWLMSRGSWLGSADVLLAFGMSFFLRNLGTFGLYLLLTYAAGGLTAAALLITGRAKRGDQLPFVPFMFVGLLLTMIVSARLFFVSDAFLIP